MKNLFKGKQYDYKIIIEAIGLYYHFGLSFRDCAKIMRKLSIPVYHTTIYRWNKQYGKILYHLWKKRNRKRRLSKSWRIDETYVKVKGRDRYLYCAIDSNGHTLDMWLRNHRDTISTKAFMKRLLRDYGQPRTILVTDKYAPSLKAVKELKEDGIFDKKVKHYKSKYLNNIIEPDHRQVKSKITSNRLIPLPLLSKELKLPQPYTKRIGEKLSSSSFRCGMKLKTYLKQHKKIL